MNKNNLLVFISLLDIVFLFCFRKYIMVSQINYNGNSFALFQILEKQSQHTFAHVTNTMKRSIFSNTNFPSHYNYEPKIVSEMGPLITMKRVIYHRVQQAHQPDG